MTPLWRPPEFTGSSATSEWRRWGALNSGSKSSRCYGPLYRNHDCCIYVTCTCDMIRDKRKKDGDTIRDGNKQRRYKNQPPSEDRNAPINPRIGPSLSYRGHYSSSSEALQHPCRVPCQLYIYPTAYCNQDNKITHKALRGRIS